MGRRTDVTKLTVAFHDFVNAPKNWYMLLAEELSIELLLTLSMEEWKFIM